jgi:hypothetical protein
VHTCSWQLLRVTVSLTIHPLHTPVFNGLTRLFACRSGGSWAGTGMPCFGGQHFPLMAAGAVLLAMGAVFIFIGECAMSTHPCSVCAARCLRGQACVFPPPPPPPLLGSHCMSFAGTQCP